VLARATAFAGNDSGSAHVAAALGRPGIVLFGPTSPARSAVGPSLRPVRQAGLPPEAAFPALAAALGEPVPWPVP
jgi:ADP-heptose:LPS heptosyltransferase